MARLLAALFAGALFGFGLALSGMIQPQKVLGFLDVAGAWDPSLLWVLGGAVGVTLLSFRYILRQPAPLFDTKFQLPVSRKIDARLVIGALLFGIGWGIGGYCPGPAVAMLAAPNLETWVVLPAMLVGALLNHVVMRKLA